MESPTLTPEQAHTLGQLETYGPVQLRDRLEDGGIVAVIADAEFMVDRWGHCTRSFIQPRDL